MKFRLALMLGVIALLSTASPAFAQAKRLAEADRKVTVGRILLKWGGYVEKVEGQNRRTWAAAMWPSLISADLDNLHKATQAVTYEGMRNALLGQTPNDDRIIDRLARAPKSASKAKALGNLAEDLVFTPINPCRVVDTRVGNKRLNFGEIRAVDVSIPGGNFVAYGGSDTDCGIPANPAAVALSVTVLDIKTYGFVRVFPYDGVYTDGSPIPFEQPQSHHAKTTNDIIVRTCQGCVQELKIYSTSIPNFAMFVTGYFMAPQATPLACLTVQNPSTAAPGGGDTVVAAMECPIGYTHTALECFSDNSQGDTYLRSFESPSNGSTGNIGCVWTNKHASQATSVRAISRCCRVPGR